MKAMEDNKKQLAEKDTPFPCSELDEFDNPAIEEEEYNFYGIARTDTNKTDENTTDNNTFQFNWFVFTLEGC